MLTSYLFPTSNDNVSTELWTIMKHIIDIFFSKFPVDEYVAVCAVDTKLTKQNKILARHIFPGLCKGNSPVTCELRTQRVLHQKCHSHSLILIHINHLQQLARLLSHSITITLPLRHSLSHSSIYISHSISIFVSMSISISVRVSLTVTHSHTHPFTHYRVCIILNCSELHAFLLAHLVKYLLPIRIVNDRVNTRR